MTKPAPTKWKLLMPEVLSNWVIEKFGGRHWCLWANNSLLKSHFMSFKLVIKKKKLGHS